jgi:hypothetical protein
MMRELFERDEKKQGKKKGISLEMKVPVLGS